MMTMLTSVVVVKLAKTFYPLEAAMYKNSMTTVTVRCHFVLAATCATASLYRGTRPYSLEEISQVVHQRHGYHIDQSISLLAEPIQQSWKAYEEAYKMSRRMDKAGLARLLRLPSEYMYRGTRMTVAAAHARWGPDVADDQPQHAEATLEELHADAAEAQLRLKALIAPGTDWARAVMLGFKATAQGESRKDAAMEKALRSTRSPITMEEYREGQKPMARVKVNRWLCDEAFDPGIKDLARIREKAEYKYLGPDGQPMYRRVRDIARLALLYDSPSRLQAAIKHINSVFAVVEIENRFAAPTALGWRDVTILVQMQLNGRVHIAELQLQLKAYALARTQAHKHYGMLRKELPSVCKVLPKDLDKVQFVILDLLKSRKVVTELEEFDSNQCGTPKARRPGSGSFTRATTEDMHRLGINTVQLRLVLLSSVRATVARRYLAFALPKILSSSAMLVTRLVVHSTDTRHIMLGMDKPMSEVEPWVFIVPAGMLIVDLAEVLLVWFWMIRECRASGNALSVPLHLLRPCMLVAVVGYWMHQVVDPLFSRINLMLC